MVEDDRGVRPLREHVLFTDGYNVTAVVFTAILFQPRGQTVRREFATLAETIEAASAMRDGYGRTGLVYAVTAGREAQVPRDDGLPR